MRYCTYHVSVRIRRPYDINICIYKHGDAAIKLLNMLYQLHRVVDSMMHRASLCREGYSDANSQLHIKHAPALTRMNSAPGQEARSGLVLRAAFEHAHQL